MRDASTATFDIANEKEKDLKSRKTQFVDVFSLGCVFHFILVPGIHPFGRWFERESNIVNGRVDLSSLACVSLDAAHLVGKMLQK